MEYHEYSEYCKKGFEENPMEDTLQDLMCATSGVAEEASELMGTVRKMMYHNKPLDKADFASEAGDVLWFFTNAIRLAGLSLEDVMEANKLKLDSRYPNGRNTNYQLNNRNKTKEKEILSDYLKSKIDA